MKEVFEELVKKIITKEDFLLFIEEINLLEQVVFKNIEVPLWKRVKGKVREEFRNELQKLEKEGIISASPNQQFSFFDEFKNYLQKIPQVKLEIAFEPSEDFLLRIKKWFKEENHQEVILDITVNPKIVGGAIIEYQGYFRDFSLVKEMDKLTPHQILVGGKHYE